MNSRLVVVSIVFLGLLVSCNSSEKKEENVSSAPAEKELQALSKEQEQKYLSQGKKIAQASFKTLSSQLQMAMAEGGISNAVTYCNVEAYPLTDSLKTEFGVVALKRATDQPRNAKNLASDKEENQLDLWKDEKAQGKKLKPVVVPHDNDQIVFYAPITMKGQCLTCHGEVEAMGADYAEIKKLYPNDQATGYSLGDLRGMWSITFQKDNDV